MACTYDIPTLPQGRDIRSYVYTSHSSHTSVDLYNEPSSGVDEILVRSSSICISTTSKCPKDLFVCFPGGLVGLSLGTKTELYEEFVHVRFGLTARRPI